MSKLSNSTGAIVLAGLTFLAGCRKDGVAPNSGATSAAAEAPPRSELARQNPPVSLEDLTPPQIATNRVSIQLPTRPSIRSTNSVEYARAKFHLDSFEQWLTTRKVATAAVACKSTKPTPENKRAVEHLQFLLNDYNSLVPQLHPGQKPWKTLSVNGSFDPATEAMVVRAEKLLNLVSSGRAGREFFFALRDAIEEAYGATPRLHKVLRNSILAANKDLKDSPNLNPLNQYPAIASFCYERSRRLIETPQVSPNYQRDIQLVKEVQHCLIKLGYDFDIKNLRQSGIRDNQTDEALKLFCRHFTQSDGPLIVDQKLVYTLVSVSTGFDFVLGATLNSEYDGVPYSRDPYKSYCGLTEVTLRSWCRDRGTKPPNLLDIKESLLRTCFREVFILPAGVEHLLVFGAGPQQQRVQALELARLVGDESYNRSPQRALRTVAYALGQQAVDPNKATMTQLLVNARSTMPKIMYGRAFMVGFNGGEYMEGLGNRLEKGGNYLVTIPEKETLRLVQSGINAGTKERERLLKEKAAAEARKKNPAKQKASKGQSKLVSVNSQRR